MLKKAVILAAILICAAELNALTFSVNGTIYSSRSSSELEKLCYGIPLSGGITKGITLDELFPAVFEAWQLTVYTENQQPPLKLSDPDLGNRLNKSFLLKNANGWSLYYQNRIFTGITKLNLECETLEYTPLEIWINWEGPDLLKAEIKRYADLHGMKINVLEVPAPDSKLISVSQANGKVPDIIMVQSSDIQKLEISGSIQSIDYMFPDGIIPQGEQAFTLDGKRWAVPFYFDTQMIFCNPKLVATPPPDWTLKDFENICSSLKSRGIIPSAWNSYSASFLIPFQIAFGKSRLTEPDGSIIITDAPTRQALEYVLKLQKEGFMQPMERDAMTSLFVGGDVAMIISASYSIPNFEELGIPFTVTPLPVNETNGNRVSPLLDFKAMAVTKKTRNTYGARRLIEYLCGIGVQQRFTSSTAKVPSLEQAWKITEKTNSYFDVLKISAEAGTVIPADKSFDVYKNTMWKMLRFAISGRMPPDTVLEKTQELVNKNMESY